MYINTSTEFNNIISGTSRHFFCRLSRDGEEHTAGFRSVKVSAQANAESDKPSIGGTVAVTVEISMDKPTNSFITGKEYQLSFGLEVNGTVEYCPIAMITAEKPKEDDGVLTFTAYDRMVSKFNFPYFTDIAGFPVDGKKILQEISSKTGVPVSNLAELPDGKMINYRSVTGDDGNTSKAKPFDGFTYREAIKYLAQIYGTFAVIGRTGKLEFKWYTESGYTVELNRSMNDAVSNEVIYTLQKIECTVDQKTLISGGGTTGIQIENPVMTQALLDSVFQKIGKMSFLPTTVSFLGDCRLDLGDIVTVKTKSGLDIKVPVMSISYEFDGGLTTEIGSYGSTEEEESTTVKGPTAQALDRVYTDLFLVKEVLANKVSVEVLEANYATITQLNAVNARIDSITATDITVEYLQAHYAQIDMANVDTAVIRQGFLESLMVSQGIIADRVVGSEVVATDVLTGVNIYADDITAGTLSVDRLILRGTDKSLVYALNNSGELVSVQTDTLDAYILTERTITADKIVAHAITATEIDVLDLRVSGFVGANQLTAGNIAAGAVTADKITADSLEAIVAKIGGFTINSKSIYKGTDSRSSTIAGIYLGTDAIRAYKSSSAYTHIENGKLTCVGADIKGDLYCNGAVYLRIPAGYFGSDTEYYEKVISAPNESTLSFGNKSVGSYLYFRYGNTASSEGFGLLWKGFQIAEYTGDALIQSDINYFNRNVTVNGTIYTNNWFRSTGATGWYSQTYGGGIYMTDTTWVKVFNNKSFYSLGHIRADGEFQETNSNGYRHVYGNYGAFWRNDGSHLYLMFTNAGDQYGGYNGLRPMRFNLANGDCAMGGALAVNGALTAGGYGVLTSVGGVNLLHNVNGNYLEVATNTGGYGINWWPSDRRLKKDIEETEVSALDYVDSIRHRKFNWKDEGRESVRIGYIAQELEETGLDVTFKVRQKDGTNLHQIDSTRLLPYITKSIQELYQIIREQAEEIRKLKQSIS